MDRERSSGLVVPGLAVPGDPEFERWRLTHPPMAGGAGWGNSQAQSALVATSNTTISLAFTSNVTAGQLVVAVSQIQAGGTSTISDIATTPNVTAWTKVVGMAPTGLACHIAWGIATLTGGCTPQFVWSVATVNVELYIGSFDTPGGAITQDGATTSNTGNVTGGQPVVLPAGGGSGLNDLVINYVQFGNNQSTIGGGWVLLGPSQNGDAASYLLNAAGNSTPNVGQAASNTWNSAVVALQAVDGVGQPFAREYPSTHFGPF